MIDDEAIRDELDAYQRQLGKQSRLNFFYDEESGDYIATHWWKQEAWHSADTLVFGKRNPDPETVLAALRKHVGELLPASERVAA